MSGTHHTPTVTEAVMASIAVVDDDDGVRESLGQLLRSAGYRASTFESAESFLASPDVLTHDCLVADVNLPGMSGVALVQVLIAAGTRLPTVLITARDDIATLALTHQLGAVPHLHKPFSDDDLLEAIERERQPES